MEEEQKPSSYGKRPLWQWLVLYLVIAVVVYGLVYYFILAKNGNGYNNNSAIAPTYTSPTITQIAPSSTAVMQKITVSGSEFAFTPATLTLKKGQPAEITFKNTGKYPHNLTIADLNVKTNIIQPGEQASVQFTPSKVGNFPFICTIPGHADKGMKGTLTVQ